MSDDQGLIIRRGSACYGFRNIYETFFEVIIPEGVVEIATESFSLEKEVRSVILPSTIKTIDTYAFAQTSLTELHIPDSITLVNHNAFSSCSNLTKLVIDSEDTAKKIHRRAFNDTRLEEIIIAGVSYPCITGAESYSTKLYVKDGVVKEICSATEGGSNDAYIYKIQKWFDAFMLVPVEKLMDVSNIPVHGLSSADDIAHVIKLRLGGKL